MSIYSTTVNCTYHDSKHLSEGTIDKKEDYSCIPCWGVAKFNKGTNAHRFWEFYQLAFPPAFQANSVTRQVYTQLVSTLTKETPTPRRRGLSQKTFAKVSRKYPLSLLAKRPSSRNSPSNLRSNKRNYQICRKKYPSRNTNGNKMKG